MTSALSASHDVAPAAEADDGGWYKWLVLLLLTLAYVLSMLDRYLPFILAESLKADLKLSDTQLGMLGGVLFAATYSLVGVPIARLADIYPRKLILCSAITLWCGMTALAGFATSFAQLATLRVGVAVGEAGCSPPAHSLIADYFRLHRRATAIAIFAIGGPIGSMIGLVLGGWLNDVASWRVAFFAIGLPGVVLAAVMALVMREPRRGAMDAPSNAALAGDERPPTLLGTFKLLWSRRSFRHMAVGVGLYAFGASSMVAFSPAFMMRSHDMTSTQVGATLGLAVGISGIIGTLAGGMLGDFLGRFDKRWYLWLPGICLGLAIPCVLVAYLTPNVWVSLIFIGPAHGLGLLFIAPSFAMTQALATPRTRAMASAVLFACMFLIGNSFGPTVIGAISDALTGDLGKHALRYALCLVALTNAWGVFHYLRGAHFLRADLERAKA